MDGLLSFLNDPKHKPLRDLIELAVDDDEDAVRYMEFLQEEIGKKFKSATGSGKYALDSVHLTKELDSKGGQDGIRAVDGDKKYYFNEFGVLKNEAADDNQLTYDQYNMIGQQLPHYLFHVLTKQYKFRAKVVGSHKSLKKAKKQKKSHDFSFKTILFSPRFNECDSIVVLIPPKRATMTYTGLAIDEGLAYGTMLPYIEEILSWNRRPSKPSNVSNAPNGPISAVSADSESIDPAPRRWGILVLDPQGRDANNNKYSIIKVYDKWLNKRIPHSGFHGIGFHIKQSPSHGTLRRSDSLDSVSTSLSLSDLKVKTDIKNLFFIGALQNGALISNLLHRRGSSLQSVVRGCIFLGSDDPYDANDVTKAIYSRCGINYLNSKLPRGEVIEGTKVNGDPFIIKRVSSGNPRYCCQAAFKSAMGFIQKAVEEEATKELQDEEYETKEDEK